MNDYKISNINLNMLIENFLFEQEEEDSAEDEESEEEPSEEEESEDEESEEEPPFDLDIDEEEPSEEEESEEDSEEEESEEDSEEEDAKEPSEEKPAPETFSSESEEKMKNIAQEINPGVAVRNYIMTLKNNKDTGLEKQIPIPSNVAQALNKVKMSDATGLDQKIIPNTEYDFDKLQSEESVRINQFFSRYRG
mgnify:CR=1 FL=1